MSWKDFSWRAALVFWVDSVSKAVPVVVHGASSARENPRNLPDPAVYRATRSQSLGIKRSHREQNGLPKMRAGQPSVKSVFFVLHTLC